MRVSMALCDEQLARTKDKSRTDFDGFQIN
jgi:hypothetical protein